MLENNNSSGLSDQEEVRFESGVIYKGSWRGKVKEGHGLQVWPDGAQYEGNWLNNQANGKGKFSYSNGDVY